MFAVADTPVKFVGLLILFAWCTLWSIYELTRPQDARQRTSNVLHLVMAVVMLLMVSPMTWKGLIAVVPTVALMGLFALCTAWFVWLAIDAFRGSDRRGWLHFVGHSAMFGAMTWHLSAMAVMQAAMSSGMRTGGMGSGPGVDMAAQRQPGGALWIFALVGIPFMTYLLISSLRSLWQAVQPRTAAAEAGCACGPDCTCGTECSCWVNHTGAIVRESELVASGGGAPTRVAVALAMTTRSCHEVRPVGTAKYRLEVIAAFAMNFGMFWMSTGLLVAILPFFALFSF